MVDFFRLFVLEARAAWMLLIVLLVEYATALRGDRVARLHAGAVPPWWRDTAYLKSIRGQLVSRLYLVLVLLATLIWANAADFQGITRVVMLAAGSALVARSWLNLKTEAVARAVWKFVAPILLNKGLITLPTADEDAPPPQS
ncbi:MAG: hypothetical protein LCH53_04415 [Bacteroidetes bacterium]|nr:hypothetical protein [Bacteroidota bacterium]